MKISKHENSTLNDLIQILVAARQNNQRMISIQRSDMPLVVVEKFLTDRNYKTEHFPTRIVVTW